MKFFYLLLTFLLLNIHSVFSQQKEINPSIGEIKIENELKEKDGASKNYVQRQPNISYSSSNYFVKGVKIAALLPTNTGDKAWLYSIAPALPSGLLLNKYTGVISGTPTVTLSTTLFQVTASNADGKSVASLTIQIVCVKISSVKAGANPICATGKTNLTAIGVIGSNAVVKWWTGAGGTGKNLGTGLRLLSVPAGTYYARVTGTCSEAVEASVTVSTFASPQISISATGSTTICPGNSLKMLAIATQGSGTLVSYTWYKSRTIIFGANQSSYNASATATYYATVKNSNGCSAPSNKINVKVIDNIPPVIPTLPTLTGECSVTATAPTTTDNCKGTITGITTSPITYSNVGTYTINWKFYDGNGNASFATQKVIVTKDNTAPNVPNLSNVTGECSATAIAPTTTDNCAGTITGTTTDPLTYTAQGNYIINWKFDDGNNNVSTATQNVVVKDITAPDAPTLPTLTGECSVTTIAPTTTDNCKGTITGTTTDPLTYTAQGNYTINWNFDDGNGNVSTATQNVVVKDNTAPDVPNLSNITGECSATATAPSTTDNCAGTITGTTTDPLTYNTQGNYTINWNFDDGNGNVSTATQNVVVKDNTAPDVPNLSNITGECSATATAPFTTDNCAGTITGTTTDPLTYTGQGNYTIHWNFDDGNGNVSTATQNVIVKDNTAPDAPTLSDLTGECSATATAPTTTDNCAGTITGTTTDPLTYNTQGNYTINWKFDDGNGNVSTATKNVVVKDITAPDVPTLSIVTGECSATATAPTTTDNCAGTITGTTTDPLTYTAQGNYTINWKFDDGNGNVSTATQNVVVKDITAPNVPNLSNVTGECSATATAPTTTDNCAGTITGTTTDPLTYTAQGNYTINWKFDDGNGNVSTATQNVVVKDITAPNVPNLSNVTGECSATATAATTTDNCAGTIIGTTTDPLTYTTKGNYTINWNFDDGNGNVSAATQNVVIKDNTTPDVPNLPNVTGECFATATAPTTNDNCAGTIIGTTTDPLTYSTQGNYTINWNFDDGNGNVSTATQNVIVKDITVPYVPNLPNVTGECFATATAPTTNDNCAGTIIGTTTDPLTYSTQGNYTINWNFDDGNGNVINAIQNIVVRDTVKPVINIVDTLPFGSTIGSCTADTTILKPQVSDNCGVASITNDHPSTIYPVGVTRVTWTATDVNGNVETAIQDIVVKDFQKPTLKIPAGIYTYAESGKCSVTITNIGTPVVTDNCGVASITNDHPSTEYNVGTTMVTWAVTDVNGNVRTSQQRIIVVDKQRPVITTPLAIKVFADAGKCTADNIILSTPVTTDNCGVASITKDYFSTSFPTGVTTVTWTATDVNGNITTALQKVTVYDYQKPVVSKPDLMYLYADSSCYANNVVLTAPTATDNCGIASFTNDHPSNSYPVGTTMVNWTAVDVNGNITTVAQKVYVVDKILPVIKTTAVTADLPTDSCGAMLVNIGTPTATDNCGIANLTNDYPSTTFPVGITTITWTATDLSGNVARATQKVTVYDRQKPTITPPAQVKVNVDNGLCTASNVQLGTPITNDNCGVASVTNNAPSVYPVGTTTVIWTVTDVNGNKNSNTQKVIVAPCNAPRTIVTGIYADEQSQKKIVVFPNPSKGNFRVNLIGYTYHKNIVSVIDEMGKTIYQTIVIDNEKATSSQFSINLTHQTPGIYFVKVINDGGMQMSRVVVQ